MKTYRAWVMLGIGLLLSIFAGLQVKHDIEKEALRQFEFTSDQVSLKIRERLDAYALILQSGAGLFAASTSVDRNDWRGFVEKLRAHEYLPSVQGIGFARVIPPNQLASHVAAIRAEGFLDYSVRPTGERATYTAIIYLEPFRDRNLRAFGFDMFSEPTRRAAMEQARDTGEAALSGKVELVQETGKEIQAGTLMYVPVYRNGAPIDTIEQRRAALIGWSYSPYRMQDLMQGILGDWQNREGKALGLKIFDGAAAEASHLLFDSLPADRHEFSSLFNQQRSIQFHGREWLLAFNAIEGGTQISYFVAWATLIGGFALTGLLSGLMLSVINTRTRARILADELTAEISAHEAELRESEFRWKFAIEGSGDGLWDWNIADSTVFFSRYWKQQIGYDEEEIGHGLDEWKTRIHPDDQSTAIDLLQAHFAGKEPFFIFEHRLRCKDGGYKWILARGVVVSRAEDNTPLRMIGTHTDISQRKQTESALASERQRMMNLVAGTNAGTWEANLQIGEAMLNERWAGIMGYTLEELGPLTLQDWPRFVHPDDLKRSSELLNQHCTGTLPEYMCEIRLRHKKGHWVWVRDQGRVMEWSKDGKPLWMYGIHLDISAIKAAQKTLEESEARFRGYIDHSPNGVFVAAPDGHFVDINPSASTLVGYSREELLAGMNVLDIFGMGDMPAYLGQFETTLKHGHQAEVALRRKNGSSVVVMLTAARLPDGRLLGFAVDLTERKRVEAAIEQQRRFRDILMEAIPGIAYALDTQGRLIFFNQLLSQFSEMPVEAHLGMNALEFFEGDDRTSITDAVRQTFEMGHTEVEATIVGRQGRRTPFFFTGNRIEFDGQPIVVGVGIDISERKLAEARMRQAMVVFNTSKQGIMTTDANGIITAINPAFSVITGYAPDEVIGHPSSMLKSGRHDPAFYQMLWTQLSSQGHWEGEIWNQRRNGELYPQWLTITAVKNPLGTTADYVSLFSDITERKEHEESMWRQANFDALTGLANRNLLADRLQRAIANAKRNEKKVGLAFLDLDGFKWINDTLGHDVGDELLIEVGRRLIGCVRDQDTAARLGGDEFTLVIHDLTDAQDMLLIGEKLVQVLHEPFLLDGHLHQLSGSVGITLYPDDGEDVQTLLKNADIAMYKAKQGGKNRYQFYARHMQLDAQERVRMEADLRSAIAAQSFALHYQPIVDADSGELIGAEALLRWQHPERGMVPPLDFIPVAEDCGLIVPIGEWVLREAARQWQTWHKQGFPPLRVSVNVSSLQFREADFCQLVERTLQEFEVTPGLLMLEMTESVLMDSSRETEARMRDVKALGVGYSLDDFGTGFSSLSYLKRFPVDVVKIDRSFIHDCPDDQNDAHLVEAIINMAHSLNLKITAEGVENKAQLEFLRNLGCDMVQGYLIDRALPPDAFGNLIERHQLLLPADGASLEESRFLAALRDDELDVDAWLTRLIGEQVSDMAVFASNSKLQTLGIDLRQAIQVHLDWRRRLNNMICNRSEIAEMNLDAAGSLHQCALGGWIANHLDSGKHCFLLLDEDHKIFHQMAGQIVRDYRFGHHSLARRALSSLAFRKASRDVVTALIACYFTLGGVERGATAGMSDIQRF